MLGIIWNPVWGRPGRSRRPAVPCFPYNEVSKTTSDTSSYQNRFLYVVVRKKIPKDDSDLIVAIITNQFAIMISQIVQSQKHDCTMS